MKINVPPLSVMSDEIVVSGEKEGVMKCKETIMAIYEEKVRVINHKAFISSKEGFPLHWITVSLHFKSRLGPLFGIVWGT